MNKFKSYRYGSFLPVVGVIWWWIEGKIFKDPFIWTLSVIIYQSLTIQYLLYLYPELIK